MTRKELRTNDRARFTCGYTPKGAPVSIPASRFCVRCLALVLVAISIAAAFPLVRALVSL